MRKYRFILSIILILSMPVLFAGCGKPSGYFETEYLQCIEYKDSIDIVGNTKAGSELEELVIPAIIKGKEVRSLGYSLRNSEFGFYGKYKKIFIPGGVISISRHDTFILSQPVKKIFLSTWPGFKSPRDGRLGGGCYAPTDYLENYIRMGYEYILAANISYMNNYDEKINGGYHWVDDVEEGDLIKTIPPEPEREGYTFGGWFTETECINEWDFEVIPFPITEDEEIGQEEQQDQNTQENDELEDIEQEEKPSLILYAKWSIEE